MKGLIFDLDGTLLDTIGDIAAAMDKALIKNGLKTHTRKEYESFIGNGVKLLAERATGGEKTEAVLKDYLEIYASENDVLTKPFDGIENALLTLSKTHKIAVLSNKPHNDTTSLVKKYFPNVPFFIAYGQRKGVPTKPDPTSALEIAHTMGLLPQDITFVGDSPEDIKTGKNANMKTAGVCWGYRSKQQLENAQADMIIQTTEELLKL